MKNFYDISKGQMTTIWIYGVIVILTLGALSEERLSSGIAVYLFLTTLFFIVFYTIGWRNNRK